MDKKYLEIKHLILHELADDLKNNDIRAAFVKIGNDAAEKSLFYNFIVEIMEENPLEYFNEIPANFFSNLDIDTVVIPNQVVRLMPKAFADSNVQNVIFKSNRISEIPEECFKGSKNLQEVTLNPNITYLDKDAFADCNLDFKIITTKEAVKRGFGFYRPEDGGAGDEEAKLFMKRHLKLV